MSTRTTRPTRTTRTTRTTRRTRDRNAALDAAMQAYAIKRAREMTPDQVEREALARWGPVPTTCQSCRINPPVTLALYGSGVWLCASCRDEGRNA